MAVVNEYTFFPCEHPRLVYNKYIDSQVMVSCGYCSACLSRRLQKYLPLIANESAVHRYTYFITLTYNDEFLPIIDLNTFLPKHYENFAYYVRQSSDYVRFVDSKLPVVSKQDVQKFIKRLRKLVTKNLQCSFRYFIAGDYGSTCFRPHYHGLLFFDSDKFAIQIKDFISSAWSINGTSLGFIDAQQAYGNGSYVASYTAASTNRPLIYDYTEFASKPLFSVCFGHSVFSESDCRKIISSSAISHVVYDNKNFKYKSIPLPSSLSSRLFPTIPTFHQLCHVERSTIYRIFSQLIGRDRHERVDYLFGLLQVDSFFRDYITLNNSELTSKQLIDKFDRVYYVVNRLSRNVQKYGISFGDYDLLIERYYFNKFNFNMSNQCHFQELLLKNGFDNETVSLFTNSVDEHYYNVSPRELHPDFFRLQDSKLRSLTKSKINHAYLDKHEDYKQFIH